MLALQGARQSFGEAVTARPACPNCGRPMHPARTTPGMGGLADLQTYRCGECGVAVTEAAGDGAAD
jgi:hypothetical protein